MCETTGLGCLLEPVEWRENGITHKTRDCDIIFRRIVETVE